MPKHTHSTNINKKNQENPPCKCRVIAILFIEHSVINSEVEKSCHRKTCQSIPTIFITKINIGQQTYFKLFPFGFSILTCKVNSITILRYSNIFFLILCLFSNPVRF